MTATESPILLYKKHVAMRVPMPVPVSRPDPAVRIKAQKASHYRAYRAKCAADHLKDLERQYAECESQVILHQDKLRVSRDKHSSMGVEIKRHEEVMNSAKCPNVASASETVTALEKRIKALDRGIRAGATSKSPDALAHQVHLRSERARLCSRIPKITSAVSFLPGLRRQLIIQGTEMERLPAVIEAKITERDRLFLEKEKLRTECKSPQGHLPVELPKAVELRMLSPSSVVTLDKELRDKFIALKHPITRDKIEKIQELMGPLNDCFNMFDFDPESMPLCVATIDEVLKHGITLMEGAESGSLAFHTILSEAITIMSEYARKAKAFCEITEPLSHEILFWMRCSECREAQEAAFRTSLTTAPASPARKPRNLKARKEARDAEVALFWGPRGRVGGVLTRQGAADSLRGMPGGVRRHGWHDPRGDDLGPVYALPGEHTEPTDPVYALPDELTVGGISPERQATAAAAAAAAAAEPQRTPELPRPTARGRGTLSRLGDWMGRLGRPRRQVVPEEQSTTQNVYGEVKPTPRR